MESKTPFYKKLWFIITTVVIIILLLIGTTLGLVFGLKGSGTEDNGTKNGDFSVQHLENNERGEGYTYKEREFDIKLPIEGLKHWVMIDTKISLEAFLDPIYVFDVVNPTTGILGYYDYALTLEFSNTHITSYEKYDAGSGTYGIYKDDLSFDYLLIELHRPLARYEEPGEEIYYGGLGLTYSFIASSNFNYKFTADYEIGSEIVKRERIDWTTKDFVSFRASGVSISAEGYGPNFIRTVVGHDISYFSNSDGSSWDINADEGTGALLDLSYSNPEFGNDGIVYGGIEDYNSKVIPTNLSQYIRLA